MNGVKVRRAAARGALVAAMGIAALGFGADSSQAGISGARADAAASAAVGGGQEETP